jgi:hypothetical protein
METVYETNFGGFDDITVKQYEEHFRKTKSEKIKVLEINGKHPGSDYVIKTGDKGKIKLIGQIKRKGAF